MYNQQLELRRAYRCIPEEDRRSVGQSRWCRWPTSDSSGCQHIPKRKCLRMTSVEATEFRRGSRCSIFEIPKRLHSLSSRQQLFVILLEFEVWISIIFLSLRVSPSPASNQQAWCMGGKTERQRNVKSKTILTDST